jgi:transketolase
MASTFSPEGVSLAVNTIKALAIDGVEKAQSGHPGTPMGLADIAFEIWTGALRHCPKDPQWQGRDRFVLSCGHASMLLYSMLHLSGYSLSIDDLKNFRQWGSMTPGHPESHLTPGVETTTGPLGQGLSNAVGFAIAAKMKAARFGELFNSRTYVIASDGDIMEGITSEASSLAGHLALDNLIVFYDDNRITIEGDTALAFSEDVGKRYEAYGWVVHRIDGHNREQIQAVLAAFKNEAKRPTMVVARTHIANGSPNAHDTSESHGSPLGKAEIALTKQAMGMDPEKTFFVPDAVRALFQTCEQSLSEAHAAWLRDFAAWQSKNPELAKTHASFEAKTLPADLLVQLAAAVPAKEEATRSLSNVIQQKVAELVPGLVGGSADLAGSTKTLLKGAKSIGPGAFEGKNFHFGIREHAMGAICNGLALAGGFIPYGATFLVFSDYMRPSVRLSAIMKIQSIWIFTHDSIFLGEDGPTHQPVEQLAALRLIPDLHVVRPADALEVAFAWAHAITRKHAPTAFVLSRQKLPTLKRREGFEVREMEQGAYVLSDSASAPDLVLIATGSEVHVAIEAKGLLEATGKHVRVVSAPCVEAFLEQAPSVRAAVLPPGIPVVAIEAGRTTGWYALVGSTGHVIGIDTYGASAPDTVLADKFGLTAKRVFENITAWQQGKRA